MMRAHVVSVYKEYSYCPDRPSSEDILMDSQDPQMSTAAAVLMSSQGSVLGPASTPVPLVLYPWVLWQRKLTVEMAKHHRRLSVLSSHLHALTHCLIVTVLLTL